MSDRHAAEKLFNELLADYRSEILPDIVSGWAEASETEKEQLTRMNNFFCGLHFLVELADCAEATLKVWEMMHDLPKSAKSSQLIRTACKAFIPGGHSKLVALFTFTLTFEVKALTKFLWLIFCFNCVYNDLILLIKWFKSRVNTTFLRRYMMVETARVW